MTTFYICSNKFRVKFRFKFKRFSACFFCIQIRALQFDANALIIVRDNICPTKYDTQTFQDSTTIVLITASDPLLPRGHHFYVNTNKPPRYGKT